MGMAERRRRATIGDHVGFAVAGHHVRRRRNRRRLIRTRIRRQRELREQDRGNRNKTTESMYTVTHGGNLSQFSGHLYSMPLHAVSFRHQTVFLIYIKQKCL